MSNFLLVPQERLEALEAKIQAICDGIDKGIKILPQFEAWVSEAEAQCMLGLKATSLWALRKKKLLRYSRIGAKIFYCKTSIEKLLTKNQG